MYNITVNEMYWDNIYIYTYTHFFSQSQRNVTGFPLHDLLLVEVHINLIIHIGRRSNVAS